MSHLSHRFIKCLPSSAVLRLCKFLFLLGRVVQSWVKITQGNSATLKLRNKSHKSKFSYILFVYKIECSRINGEINKENAFQQKKKKPALKWPRVSTNQLSNNWALTLKGINISSLGSTVSESSKEKLKTTKTTLLMALRKQGNFLAILLSWHKQRICQLSHIHKLYPGTSNLLFWKVSCL